MPFHAAFSRLARAQTPKLAARQPFRRLSLHEHQSHKLLSRFGIPVPRATVARTATEVRAAVDELGPKCVIKAQVLGGGRSRGRFDNGLRSGVQTVESAAQGEAVAVKMLGRRLLGTRRSAEHGQAVSELYVAESVDMDAEWYVAMTVDREKYGPAVVLSKRGRGRDVHVIARDRPQSLFTFHFALSQGITAPLVSAICTQLELAPHESHNLARILAQMYQVFSQTDATLLELDPLAHSADGTLTCLSAHLEVDRAAERRQPALFALRDLSQEVADEVEAERHGLVYVRMDGNIGTVVNGAGLAMATSDAIGFHGGASANFLDAGGKATSETMRQAFAIVARDARVRAILVNIYGGLTRCDMIAESIISAAHELHLAVPMVVRLQGTNSARGLELLHEANLGLHVETDFGRAAQRVVELASATAR